MLLAMIWIGHYESVSIGFLLLTYFEKELLVQYLN